MPDEKVSELADQLREAFPDLNVRAPAQMDDRLRWRFEILDPGGDHRKARTFTVSLEGLGDLHPSDVVAVVQSPAADAWWRDHPGETLHVRYHVVDGLYVPKG